MKGNPGMQVRSSKHVAIIQPLIASYCTRHEVLHQPCSRGKASCTRALGTGWTIGRVIDRVLPGGTGSPVWVGVGECALVVKWLYYQHRLLQGDVNETLCTIKAGRIIVMSVWLVCSLE